jgi:alginate O-acetyltransferase complex protein AlgI
MLSYVIDVYNKKVKVQKNLINLACYVSAFPQLIAGPIVRYSSIEKELNKRTVSYDDLYDGIKKFIVGLSKKVLIANNVSFICDQIFDFGIVETGFIGIVIASISYTLQIYFDFSGYSDMAIGLGRMCGFHYSENFNLPYLAHSVTDFWRRWHISLSSFFRDYVYIPLGGNRVNKIKFIRNVLVVWMLTGLWHGDSWNFIIWGLYYGILLLIEKFFFAKQKDTIISHIITMIIVNIGWLIFRQTDMTSLLTSFKALFGMYGLGSIKKLELLGILSSRYVLSFIFGILLSFDLIKIKEGIFKDILLLILFAFTVILVVIGSYNPFIYFRF